MRNLALVHIKVESRGGEVRQSRLFLSFAYQYFRGGETELQVTALYGIVAVRESEGRATDSFSGWGANARLMLSCSAESVGL